MKREEASQIKRAGVWFNAAASAWNMGEAGWLFDERSSVLIRVWVEGYNERPDADEVARCTDAAVAVEKYARERGIDLKRHRSHRVG